MPSVRFFDDLKGQRLAQALKSVRRLRGKTAAEVASAMGMPLRSYEHFESGVGKFDFEKVRRFAEVLNADPAGILFAVMIGSPTFAAHCAGNKAATALLVALEQFDRDMGERLGQVDTAALLAEVGEAFARLGAARRHSESLIERPDGSGRPIPPDPAKT